MLAHWLERQWQRDGAAQWLIRPLSWLFAILAGGRRLAYRYGLLRRQRLPVPVIVVGNISVGGVGKTPVVLALTHALQAAGYQPGILSRGYGGQQSGLVAADSDPIAMGDEPVLLAQRSACPVSVNPDRYAAGRALLAAYPACDVLICDDGLQHYRLQRQLEVIVVRRQAHGNGHLLPAGPLREPLWRLKTADILIESGALPQDKSCPQVACPSFHLTLQPGPWTAVDDPQRQTNLTALRKQPLLAIAGIGHPQRFFDSLQAMGLQVETLAFADHHAYTQADFSAHLGKTLLMTEKDAVKCRGLGLQNAWYLPVQAELSPCQSSQSLQQAVLALLKSNVHPKEIP